MDLLCLESALASYSSRIAITKSSDNLALVVHCSSKMRSSLIKAGSVCKLQLILVVTLMLFEIMLVVFQLSTKLGSALFELALANFIFSAPSTLERRTGNTVAIIVINLADIGKGKLLSFLLVLIHILFKDLRKLLYFSALKNVICKGIRGSGNLVESDSLKLLCIAIISVNRILEADSASVSIFTKRLCSSKAL